MKELVELYNAISLEIYFASCLSFMFLHLPYVVNRTCSVGDSSSNFLVFVISCLILGLISFQPGEVEYLLDARGTFQTLKFSTDKTFLSCVLLTTVYNNATVRRDFIKQIYFF